MGRSLEERFWEKVDRRGPDECWPWTAYTTKKGYGLIAALKGQMRAHRLSYELHNGPILDNLHVLHECDNPPCCNPRHLFLGTNIDNVRDMVKKGRQARREGAGSAKLTEAQVEEIRRDYVKNSRTHGQPALARKYHVSHAMIGYIVREENWS